MVPEEREKSNKMKKAYGPGLEGIGGLRVVKRLEDEASSCQYFAVEIEEPEYGHWRDWIRDALRETKI